MLNKNCMLKSPLKHITFLFFSLVCMIYSNAQTKRNDSLRDRFVNTSSAIDIVKEGIELASKTNNLAKLIFLYTSLAENYRKSNQLMLYNSTLERIISLKDSLYIKNSGDAI